MKPLLCHDVKAQQTTNWRHDLFVVTFPHIKTNHTDALSPEHLNLNIIMENTSIMDAFSVGGSEYPIYRGMVRRERLGVTYGELITTQLTNIVKYIKY